MAPGRLAQPEFLPMSRPEMDRLGWDELDALLVSGDAYVDHPSFGPALLGRLLVSLGFRTGIVAQPGWTDEKDLLAMGRPRLFVGVTAGALDSMLAHYTAFRKKRSDDAYTPGGRAGARPNRAVTVYANLARRAFPGLPVVLGGIEASLRRAAHYDFWTDKLRRSVLLDAKAELLAYGMAESALAEIARRLEAGRPLRGVPGTAFAGSAADIPEGAEVLRLPSFEEIQADPRLLLAATLLLEEQMLRGDAWAVQDCGGRSVLFAPPAPPLSTADLDALYALPYARRAHPAYREGVPALDTVRGGITAVRGCGGGCAFCSLALHQGRTLSSRSRKSVLQEAERIAPLSGVSGSITDVGGPTANMWGGRCAGERKTCKRRSCLHPAPCPFFEVDQKAFVDLLRAVRSLPGVKNVRVASGIRHDLGLTDPSALSALVAEFTGGQLKTAPEHVSDRVLRLMRKPGREVFERFLELFRRQCEASGREFYVVPYLMSAHPGCTDQDMRELRDWLAARGWRPRQVQCFIPTPGTAATAMYFGGCDARGRAVPVARTDAERLRQHGLLVPREDGGAPPARRGRGGKAGGRRKGRA